MMVTNADINTYGNALIEELRKFDACATELRMVTEDMIRSYITDNVHPRDVAWAIVE